MDQTVYLDLEVSVVCRVTQAYFSCWISPKASDGKTSKNKTQRAKKAMNHSFVPSCTNCMLFTIWAFNLKVPGVKNKMFFLTAVPFVCACTCVCVVSVHHYSILTFYYLEPKGKGKIRIKDDIYIEKSHGLYLPQPRFLGPLNSELIP